MTVQSKDQSTMDALTAKIDQEVRLGSEGPSRTTLGAIEATMSRVVDSDSAFLVTKPPTLPTLALLSDISYDSDTSEWNLHYKTSRSEPTDELNFFRRILYTSKNGNVNSGDLHNPCLNEGITTADCFAALNTDYLVDDNLVVEGTADSLALGDSEIANAVTVDVTDESLSREQNLVLKIPHAAIRNSLGKKEIVPHPTEGSRVVWSFGVGMVFVGDDDAQNNIIMFDTFNLIEISNQLVVVSKSNSYSVAKHVSFWTQRVVDDPTTASVDESEIVIAKVEYTLEAGHTLDTIESTINEIDVCADPRTAVMQGKIDALNNSACILTSALCSVSTYTAETNGVTSTWATLALPVFDFVDHQELRLSTLLNTIDTSVPDGPARRVVSALNFATRQLPQDACSATAYETFNAIDHTSAELYRGVGVHAESINGYFSVHNSGGESTGTTDSLLTIVIKPKDANGIAYMDTFPNERILLDDLYISHALPTSTLPATVDNQIRTGDQGRSRVLVDEGLLTACPEEKTGSDFVYEAGPDGANAFTCVTTHDWGVDGNIIRPYSTPNGPYFVYSVTDSTEADAKAWLKEYVIGQISESADTIAADIYNNSITRVSGDYVAKSKIYWVWPTYYWPDESPAGLKDTAIISMAWSLSAPAATPAPPPSRRLLSMTPQNSEPVKKPILHRRSMKTRVRPEAKHLAQVQAKVQARENDIRVLPRTLPVSLPSKTSKQTLSETLSSTLSKAIPKKIKRKSTRRVPTAKSA